MTCPLCSSPIKGHTTDGSVCCVGCGMEWTEKEWMRETSPLCEVCDDVIVDKPITSEETGKRQFCSDYCCNEAKDDLRIARIEADQQFALYGDDYDSWYR